MMLRFLILVPLCVGCALTEPGPVAASPDSAESLRTQLQQTTRATEYLNAAARALSAGRPQDCLRELAFAAEFDAPDATWHLLAAMAHLDQQRPAEAALELLDVVRMDPGDAGSWALLGRARYELQQLDGARQAFEEAVRRAPDEAQHYGSLGLVCLESQLWEQAHAAFSSALELDASLQVAHHGLAQLYSLAGLDEASVVALERAVAIAPEDPGLRVELGHALRDFGMQRQALASYEVADTLDPGNPWIAANLGAVCHELHELHDARDHFLDARRGFAAIGWTEPSIDHSLGQIYLALGRPLKARDALEAAHEVLPDLQGLAEELGLLLADMGEQREARRVLGPAADRDALSRTALYELCRLEEQFGDVQRAHALASKLLIVPRDDPDAALLAARLRLRSTLPMVRDTAAAAERLEELTSDALANHPSTWLLLAEARVASGELDGAVQAVDRALVLLTAEGPEAREALATREKLVRQLASARNARER